MLAADFNLMEKQGWRHINPGTCSLAFSANYFWILVILADNLVGCPNQPHIFIAFLWGTPVFSIGLHTYTGEIKRPRAVRVDMQAIHFCWNLRIPIMWEKNPPFEVGDSKRKPKKIVFQESFFRGWAVGFCWCFFYLKNFPQIRCFGWFDGISTQIDKDLQEDWSSIWMNYSSHIHPAFTISYIHESDVYLHIFLWNHLLRRAGLSSVYTKTSGWLLEGFPHPKKLPASLGCYIFLSPLFPPGPSWQEHHAQLDALIASLHVGDAVGGDAVCRGGGSERLSCFFG